MQIVELMVPAIKSRNSKAAWATALTITAFGVIWWRLSAPPSPEQIARQTISAVENGSGARLLKHAHPDEIQALELNEEKLDKLLMAINDSVIDKHEGKLSATVENDGAGSVAVTKRVALANGHQGALGFVAVQTDSGPKVVGLVNSLYHFRTSQTLSTDASARRGLARMHHDLKLMPQISAEFGNAGIKGIYIADAEQSFVYNWDEWTKRLESRIEKGESQLAAQQNQITSFN